MSVPVMKRKESSMQFLDTARELYEHTLKYTSKQFAKKDFGIISKVRDKVDIIFSNVVEANAIYPNIPEDFDERIKLFKEAKQKCDSLTATLSSIKRVLQNTVTEFGWSNWGKLLNEETELIARIIRSDKERKNNMLNKS